MSGLATSTVTIAVNGTNCCSCSTSGGCVNLLAPCTVNGLNCCFSATGPTIATLTIDCRAWLAAMEALFGPNPGCYDWMRDVQIVTAPYDAFAQWTDTVNTVTACNGVDPWWHWSFFINDTFGNLTHSILGGTLYDADANWTTQDCCGASGAAVNFPITTSTCNSSDWTMAVNANNGFVAGELIAQGDISIAISGNNVCYDPSLIAGDCLGCISDSPNCDGSCMDPP